MIIGGVSGSIDISDDIIRIRMNWAIQIELSENSGVRPPNRQTASSREEAYGRKVAPSTRKARKPSGRAKGRYWSKEIAEWLAQQASPFWNTIRTGGTTAQAGAAYIGARLWRATGGKVVKFVAKQSLKQAVMRPAVGIGGGLALYFAAVAVVGHDIYVALDESVETQKFFNEGVKIGGGGFGG